MSQARTAARIVNNINKLSEGEYRQMRKFYNDHRPYAQDRSFEEYLEEAARAEAEIDRVTRRDVSGPRESRHRSQEAGRSYQDRAVIYPPRPRESGYRSHEATGRFNNDQTFVTYPDPRESRQGSQEAASRFNYDRTLVSRPRFRPLDDDMHHATSPSHSPEARHRTGCRDCDCEDSLNDEFPDDDDYSDDDTLAGTPVTNTSHFSEDCTLRGHGTGSRYPSDSADIHDDDDDDDYDAQPRTSRSEAIRSTSTRHGPISRPQRRAQYPPPHSVHCPPPRSMQSPPPPHPDYLIPRAGRIPPPPSTHGSPAHPLPPTPSSQAYSADRRSYGDYDAPSHGTQRGPVTTIGMHCCETYYIPCCGPTTGNRRGGCLRDY